MYDKSECYKMMQENCGIEVGDYVKILRKAQNYELGWDTVWDDQMNYMVGSTYKVDKVNSSDGFVVNDWYFPWFVLEKIKPKIDLYNKDTALKLHWKLWNWLVNNVEYTKVDWPGWEIYDINVGDVHQQCFLCEYTKENPDGLVRCYICPGQWKYHRHIHQASGDAMCQRGEYGFYEVRNQFSPEVLKRVYKIIRDICE